MRAKIQSAERDSVRPGYLDYLVGENKRLQSQVDELLRRLSSPINALASAERAVEIAEMTRDMIKESKCG